MIVLMVTGGLTGLYLTSFLLPDPVGDHLRVALIVGGTILLVGNVAAGSLGSWRERRRHNAWRVRR